MATNVSLLAAPKNSTFIVNDILLYAASGNGFRFPEKKTREWTEWQGRRPWRCNVQMCVKNKTSSARENAFRPASSINDSSFPTGILNNLPPPFFPSFLPPFPNASIRSDGSSTNQPTICSSGMIGIGDQRKQEEGEEGEEEISRLVGALEARARGNKRGTGPMVGRKPHRGANYSNPVRFPKPYSAVPIRVALVSCVVEFMKRLPHTVCVAVSPSLPPRLPPTDSHFRAKPTDDRRSIFLSPRLLSFPSPTLFPRARLRKERGSRARQSRSIVGGTVATDRPFIFRAHNYRRPSMPNITDRRADRMAMRRKECCFAAISAGNRRIRPRRPRPDRPRKFFSLDD